VSRNASTLEAAGRVIASHAPCQPSLHGGGRGCAAGQLSAPEECVFLEIECWRSQRVSDIPHRPPFQGPGQPASQTAFSESHQIVRFQRHQIASRCTPSPSTPDSRCLWKPLRTSCSQMRLLCGLPRSQMKMAEDPDIPPKSAKRPIGSGLPSTVIGVSASGARLLHTCRVLQLR
jgi:hypothetical protein